MLRPTLLGVVFLMVVQFEKYLYYFMSVCCAYLQWSLSKGNPTNPSTFSRSRAQWHPRGERAGGPGHW